MKLAAPLSCRSAPRSLAAATGWEFMRQMMEAMAIRTKKALLDEFMFLDENEHLISALYDDHRLGKLEDFVRNFERLLQNLDCLATLMGYQSPRCPTAAQPQQDQPDPGDAPEEPVAQFNSEISLVAQPATLHDQMHTQDQLQQQQMQQAASDERTSGTSVFDGDIIMAYSRVDGSSEADSILPGTVSSTEGQGSITITDFLLAGSEQQGEYWDFGSGDLLDMLLPYNDGSSF
ncbi:hypothetical protein OPV22_018966 [Ensete ventricosum]|uniref:Uncharacterized protein n=1 Tax=Ensete ventricosum TaxID=4639 RepID=A0AAV8QWS8_ENSVE|nr:hypothetical protein OPV22_018966 [Ensete ventricosum]